MDPSSFTVCCCWPFETHGCQVCVRSCTVALPIVDRATLYGNVFDLLVVRVFGAHEGRLAMHAGSCSLPFEVMVEPHGEEELAIAMDSVSIVLSHDVASYTLGARRSCKLFVSGSCSVRMRESGIASDVLFLTCAR